jgi:hypothetical protein
VGGKREKELRSNGAGIGTVAAVFDDADADDVAADAAVTPFVDKPLPLLRASAVAGPGDALGARRGGGSALPSASRCEDDCCCCLLGPPASRGLPAAGPPAADGSAIKQEGGGRQLLCVQASNRRITASVFVRLLSVVAADRRSEARQGEIGQDKNRPTPRAQHSTAQAESNHRPQAGSPQARAASTSAHPRFQGRTDVRPAPSAFARPGLEPPHFGGETEERGQQSRRLWEPTATRLAGQTQKKQLQSMRTDRNIRASVKNRG